MMENLLQRYWRTWAIEFLLMMALWFVFVGQVEPAEALVGVAAAALAATGDMVIRRGLFTRYILKGQWVFELLRLPGYVVAGTAIIYKVLCRRLLLGRQPRSRLQSLPFHSRGPTAESAARSALALAIVNISPNTIAIGIDKQDESMLVHQIESAGAPPAIRRFSGQ